MKYGKRIREEAALICAIAASSESPSWLDACRWSGNDLTSRWFAERAASHAIANSFHSPFLVYYAEAEALIRTGWTP